MKKDFKISKQYRPIQPSASGLTGKIRYSEYRPDDNLQHFIYCYWHLKTTQKLKNPFHYRVVADGCIDIFFETDNPEENYVMGFSRAYSEFSLDSSFGYFGIRFLPTAFPRLFGIDASELANRCEQLKDVCSKTSNFIASYGGCASSGQLKSIFDKYFLTLLTQIELEPDYRVSRALEAIFGMRGNVKIKKDFNDIGVSRRQLRRLFSQYIGDTPKAFSKVVRFQHVLNINLALNNIPPNKLLFDAGYYDQPHFIKEFKTLSGVTPGQSLHR